MCENVPAPYFVTQPRNESGAIANWPVAIEFQIMDVSFDENLFDFERHCESDTNKILRTFLFIIFLFWFVV